MAVQLHPSRLPTLASGQMPGPNAQLIPQEQAAPAQPDDAFVWTGNTGQRMTPAEVTIARELAKSQMAAGADYSPVQHWTQGAARAMQGILGGLSERDARRAAEANDAESDAVLKALMNPPQADGLDARSPSDAIVAALSNRYISDDVRAVAGQMWDRDYEANKPQYFNSGNDRVAYDPRTGQSSVLYQGQSDAEDYATSLGFQPGTPEFNTAMQDYVLRANGPTAFGYEVDLEGVRQDNRETLEGVRQRNRLSLRQTPTYGQTHPRPGSGGGSGGGNHPPRNTGNVYAPILDKVARGIPLTSGEQRVLDMRGRGGREPTSTGDTSTTPPARTATDPKTGKKVKWDGKAWVPLT